MTTEPTLHTILSTEQIIERLEVLEGKLNTEGLYVGRFTCEIAIERLRELNAAWRPA
jgi:hypothetical protein